jgi:glycosyltransferase involved in cell wall biosynthesis
VDRIGQFIHRAAFRLGVVPVAVASEVARTFEAQYGFVPRVIPNGIDLDRFRAVPPRQAARPFTILTVARLEPQKNPELLADSVAALPFAAQLLIAGEGRLRGSLSGRPRVTLLGSRTDIPELLAEADVFALASDYEGHPIALMEAMAAGLPVVATAVGGVPEIVGDAGLLVPPRDGAALAAAFTRLREDSELRAELGRRAWERAASFSAANMVRAYETLFEEVVRGRP